MRAHVHAALMAQYAEDARETDKPWERWETTSPFDGNWHMCNGPLPFDHCKQYRRKPRTININGFEVPEPLREAPELGAMCFSVSTRGRGLCPTVGAPWHGSLMDHERLRHGVVHITREAAELHAKALLSFTEIK